MANGEEANLEIVSLCNSEASLFQVLFEEAGQAARVVLQLKSSRDLKDRLLTKVDLMKMRWEGALYIGLAELWFCSVRMFAVLHSQSLIQCVMIWAQVAQANHRTASNPIFHCQTYVQ